MMKAILAVGALMMATAATPATAQSALLTSWAFDDIKQAFGNVGATVTDSGVDNSGSIYVYGKTNKGLKFVAYGAVCSGKPKRCKGLNLTNSFNFNNNAEVDARVKTIDRMAISVRDGGNKSLVVYRYIIFDGGITRKNLEMNISVFLNLAQDVWNGSGAELSREVSAPTPAPVRRARPAAPVVTEADPDALTCERYGYERGKPGFADCMMQLDMARKALEQADAQYARDKALYQEQLAAAEKERKRQLGLRQLEMGLGLLAGGGVRQQGSTPSAPLAPPPPPTTRTIRLPNGNQVVCQTIGSYTSCR